MLKKFPSYKQLDTMDCGPTCLRMIAKYYGKTYSLQYLRNKTYLDREGVSLLGISDAAEEIGFRTIASKLDFETLKKEVPLPCIVHWNQNHFIIIYKIKKDKVYISDPAHGLLVRNKSDFLKGWNINNDVKPEIGVVLLFEPTPKFYESEDEASTHYGFNFLFKYLFRYKKLLSQIVLGLLVGSLLQIILPFLTQVIVDFGIGRREIGFIYLILVGQIIIFISKISVEFIQSWILLHISTRINISIISDFLIKLVKLPVGFFDSKMIGDLLQRIGDHQRIESFLTNTTLKTIFSTLSILILGSILIIYDSTIFAIFITGSILYVAWILIFLKKRKKLDYLNFDQQAANQSSLIEIITGIQEIKLNSIEKQKRWEWERVQARLFKVRIKQLSLSQYQQAGSRFIEEIKNIFISFFSAKQVIDGNMTLGMMVAVSYIIGQLNSPITQLIDFIRSLQDASISLERLGEIHDMEDEANAEDLQLNILPNDKSISIKKLSFRYGGPDSLEVLKNITMTVPESKVTAIVGKSGSGKTTLLKLLQKFYEPQEGEIEVGDINIKNIRNTIWRNSCGVVMQDGFIFSDNIMNNISLEEVPDMYKLFDAAKMANIHTFIDSLPLGYNTKIGNEGKGISQGQKQRLLIARAVYKNPEYIFLDEATNALDANNELTIIRNLREFFENKTVIVVAHRLSTVKRADQIVVLEEGEIVEIGTHKDLTRQKGVYYNLVKDQLELGN